MFEDLLGDDICVGLVNLEVVVVGRISKEVFEVFGFWSEFELWVKVFKLIVNEIVNDFFIGIVDVVIVWDIIIL